MDHHLGNMFTKSDCLSQICMQLETRTSKPRMQLFYRHTRSLNFALNLGEDAMA